MVRSIVSTRALFAFVALLAPLVLFPLLRQPELAIGAVAGCLALLAAWVSPGIPLGLGGGEALVPLLDGGLPEGVVRIASVGWFSMAILFVVLRNPERLRAAAILSPAVFASMLLAAIMLARLGDSPAYEYGALKTQLFISVNLMLMLVGLVTAQSRRDMRWFLALALASALLAAFLTYQEVAKGGLTTLPDRYSVAADQSPIWLGRQTGAGALIALWIVMAWGRASRLVAAASLPLLGVAFLAAGSRGPVVALILGLIALVGLSLKTRGVTRARVPLVLGVVVFALAIASQTVPSDTLQRIGSLFVGGDTPSDVTNGRSALWDQATQVFLSHPWLGAGTGSFSAVNPDYRYPHNLLFEAASEWGLLGLLTMVAILAAATVSIGRSIAHGSDDDRSAAILVASLFVFFLANAMFSGDVTGNGGLWLAIGLGTGLQLRTKAHAAEAAMRAKPTRIRQASAEHHARGSMGRG